MGERLYRGKLKVDNGEHKKGDWVKGYYVNLIDGNATHPHIYGAGEIYPETLGQSTGITDKNGNEIFEGDIIRVDFKQEYVGIKPQPSYIGVVIFNDKDCAFAIRRIGKWTQFFFQHGLIKTVIGNIQDNPELLNGSDTE